MLFRFRLIYCTMVTPFILYCCSCSMTGEWKGENHWRGVNELYGLYSLHYTKGQMHIYLIVSSIKIITKRKFFAVYRFKSARMVSCLDLLYGGKLWRCENLTKLMTDQNSQNFPHPNFYISIVKFHVNIKQNEDIFGTCSITCRVPSITFLIAMACG